MHNLAQLNIALMQETMDSPRMKDFVDNLERINELAESSEGFVWRLQDEQGDATSIRTFGEEYLVNLTLWRDVESLHNFVYRSAHVDVLRRKSEWFERLPVAAMVLWWVPQGHKPTPEEAWERLTLLQQQGPTREAFTFKERFDSGTSL